ncbi:TetR/AcrR family transcriptional regulator [Umezawaea sp. NPDC059074]|uniref:TetR/AcrR family transcriptional regulator n=1 Tax=Umezawaea sp. NPDC059074 TaxID=3346716 RepID=UPI0036756DB7
MSTPRRRDAQANLARILSAATAVYAERGCSAPLSDIAEAAQVGVATVYRTFATKDDLIHDVYEPAFRAAERQALDASLAEDPWTGITSFLEQAVTTMAADRGFRDLLGGSSGDALGWSRPRTPHRLVTLVEDSHNRTGTHLDKLVRRAREAGVVRDDLVAGDLLLLSMAAHTAVEIGGSAHPLLYRRMLGFLLDGLVPARGAPTPLPEPGLTNPQIADLDRRRHERTSGAPEA